MPNKYQEHLIYHDSKLNICNWSFYIEKKIVNKHFNALIE